MILVIVEQIFYRTYDTQLPRQAKTLKNTVNVIQFCKNSDSCPA